MLGVPWYSLANALQQQLRETLITALTSGSKPPLATDTSAPKPPQPTAYDPPPIRALSENDINSMRAKLVRGNTPLTHVEIDGPVAASIH